MIERPSMADIDNEKQEEVQTNETELEGDDSSEDTKAESSNPHDTDSMLDTNTAGETVLVDSNEDQQVDNDDQLSESASSSEPQSSPELDELAVSPEEDDLADEVEESVGAEAAEEMAEAEEVSEPELADESNETDEITATKEMAEIAESSDEETKDVHVEEVEPVEAETRVKAEEVVESEVSVDSAEPIKSEEALAAEALIASQAPVEVEEEVEETPEVTEPEDDRHWYVVHCYSGYENKVRHNLEQRIETMGMKDRIFDVVVPTEEEIEVKEGKRRTVERRVFPGYILVQMIMSEESWYVVRNTPGVTGFVGMGNEPTPLRPEEVSSIIKRMEADAPRIKLTYAMGAKVRIIDGPFNDFIGTVDHIDMERAKVRVMVSFFGRETPVELDFLQVEKS